MQIKIKKLLIFFLIPLLLATVGLGCKRSCSSANSIVKKEIQLTYWSVFTDTAYIDPIIKAFQAQYPYIKINYKNFGNDYTSYRNEIINALAAGKGPDIWSVHHTWLLRDKNLISACPQEIMTVNNFRDTFVEAAQKDNILDNAIYGVPFSLDTLALFYNQDLLNQAHIVNPPQTWDEFKEDVKKLTIQNEKGQITQAGAAIGTAQNINRAPDLVALLMMQDGAAMTDANKQSAAFNINQAVSAGKSTNPGEEALTFYTDFASPKKDIYTWNPLQHYSIDAFTEGTLGMMLSYSFHLPTIKLKAPNLNFRVSAIPQISGGREVNFANYWTNVVSIKTKYQKEAWTFLTFASKAEVMQKFCKDTRRPPARRDLFEMFKDDPEMAPFTKQILTADTWARKDNDATDQIFEDMVEDVVLGKKTVKQSLDNAAAAVTQTMR